MRVKVIISDKPTEMKSCEKNSLFYLSKYIKYKGIFQIINICYEISQAEGYLNIQYNEIGVRNSS